jgi:hypothetical protein
LNTFSSKKQKISICWNMLGTQDFWIQKNERKTFLEKIRKNKRENSPPRVPSFTIESLLYSLNYTKYSRIPSLTSITSLFIYTWQS